MVGLNGGIVSIRKILKVSPRYETALVYSLPGLFIVSARDCWMIRAFPATKPARISYRIPYKDFVV